MSSSDVSSFLFFIIIILGLFSVLSPLITVRYLSSINKKLKRVVENTQKSHSNE